jgi:hypothetical protein
MKGSIAMVRTKKKKSVALARRLGCLLLVFTLAPASPAVAGPGGPGGLVRFFAEPNPVIIPYGTETGSTTITWDSGDKSVVPEVWIPDLASRQEMRLPGITTASGSTTLTVQMGHTTTVRLYTPGHGTLLASAIITTQRPSGNGVSAIPTPVLITAPGAYLGNALHPTLQPSYVNTRGRRHTESSSSPFCDIGTEGTLIEPPPAATGDTITVGFAHYYNDDTCMLNDAFWRGAVQFDLSGFKNQNFLSASLTFRVTDGLRYDPDTDLPEGPYETGARWSAAAGVDRATDNWAAWPAGEYHDYINGDGKHLFVPSGYMANPTITLDVSSIVRDWLNGAMPNDGFVFYGFDEGFPRNNNTYLSNYSDFTLTLTYA